MEYKIIDKTLVLRLDINDEIVQAITDVISQEKIKLGTVSGIGAVDQATIGIFKPEDKQYYENNLEGDFELLALNGNVSTMDNKPYVHLHITLGDDKGNAFGGHLNKARISVTGEIFINIIEGQVDRIVDPTTGLNIIDFK